MAEPTPIKKLFTRPRFNRLRRLGFLPAPVRRCMAGAWLHCYDDADSVLREFERLYRAGLEKWIELRHGPGRPRLDEIARLAGVYRG